MDTSKGTYKLKTKNGNFPDGKLEYDFNNINGFSGMEANKFLQKRGYMPAVSMSDDAYNVCLFALASKKNLSD